MSLVQFFDDDVKRSEAPLLTAIENSGNKKQALSKCAKCEQYKTLDHFYPDKSRAKGKHKVSSYCKECKKEQNALRDQKKNPPSSKKKKLPKKKVSAKKTKTKKKKEKETERTCSVCGITKPIDSFRRGNSTVRKCRPCLQEYKERARWADPPLRVFHNKRTDAKRRGIEFSMTWEKWEPIMRNITHCPDCGKESVWHSERELGKEVITEEGKSYIVKRQRGHGVALNTMTFDQINASKGYTDTNVRFICYECNGDKGKLTIEEWLAVLTCRVKSPKWQITEIDPMFLPQQQLSLNLSVDRSSLCEDTKS